MLLKRLTGILPAYLVDHIPTLESFDIKTTENLLYTPRAYLSKVNIPSQHIDELIGYIIQATGPKVLDGAEALDKRVKDDQWYGWGRTRMDGVVDWDGIGIMEISGSKRVGKSLLALYAAIQLLVHDDTAVCRWIDTEGSFNPSRIAKIVEQMDDQVLDTESVLSRLIIVPCFSIEPDMFGILGEIRGELESSDQDANGQEISTKPTTRMIVVDPISNLLKDTLLATTAQAMVTMMEEIAELTYEYNLSTIITNTSASSLPRNELSRFSTTTTKPSLGTAFTYHSDISILVQETGRVFGMVDEQERERVRSKPGLRGVMEVLKSRVSPAGRWAVFETDGTSLMDVIPSLTEDEAVLAAAATAGPARPVYGPLSETMMV